MLLPQQQASNASGLAIRSRAEFTGTPKSKGETSRVRLADVTRARRSNDNLKRWLV